MIWLLSAIFVGGMAGSYALSRRRSSKYERLYGIPLARKWSAVEVFAVWGWVGLGVGLIIIFPRYWWLSMAILVLVTWILLMVAIFRVRRGIKSDPSRKPHGLLDAFARGGRSGR